METADAKWLIFRGAYTAELETGVEHDLYFEVHDGIKHWYMKPDPSIPCPVTETGFANGRYFQRYANGCTYAYLSSPEEIVSSKENPPMAPVSDDEPTLGTTERRRRRRWLPVHADESEEGRDNGIFFQVHEDGVKYWCDSEATSESDPNEVRS